MKLKETFRKPALRHGMISGLLVVLLLAIVVLVNVCVQSLEDEYGWWTDLSFNGYATTSEETELRLSALEKDVELILLYQSGSIDENLHQVLKAYELLNPHLSIQVLDIAQNPGVLTRFQGNENTGIEADTIIVNCPSTGRYQVLGYNDFMTAGYNTDTGEWELEGLAYEKNLTEAILNVSQNTIPTIGILQGHGELDTDSLSTLITLVESNGYATRTVTLSDGDTLEGISILLIASPINDFSENEAEALAAYAKEGGQFFVTRDYTDPSSGMPVYFSFLNDYGVVPLSGVVVAGAEDQGSYYDNQIYLLPYMESLDFTLPLISGDMDILLMPAASAFENPPEGDTNLSAGTVLKTGPHAYVRNLEDGVDSIEKQEGDREGELTLAIFSHRTHANGNISQMFACGCSLMFTEEYIYQRTYCQEFVLAVLGQLAPANTNNLDIEASTAVRPGLKTGSETSALVVMIALPLLVIAIGVVYLSLRRSR